MSHAQLSRRRRRRGSLLSSLLCCRSDTAMMEPPIDAPITDQRLRSAFSSQPSGTQPRAAAQSAAAGAAAPVTHKPARLIPVAAGSPPHWDPIDPAHNNKTLVLLAKDNPRHAAELAQVHSSWTRTGGAGSIVSVHRVQNLALWSAFEKKKAELQKDGLLTPSDAVVYHGARHNSPGLIHAGSVGFDPSKGVSAIGLCWFAANASYSSAYCHVVSSSTVPFSGSGAGCILKQIFQAQLTITTMDAARQAYFTVSHAARAYPQYLITFQ